jgi:hypothetical protein
MENTNTVAALKSFPKKFRRPSCSFNSSISSLIIASSSSAKSLQETTVNSSPPRPRCLRVRAPQREQGRRRLERCGRLSAHEPDNRRRIAHRKAIPVTSNPCAWVERLQLASFLPTDQSKKHSPSISRSTLTKVALEILSVSPCPKHRAALWGSLVFVQLLAFASSGSAQSCCGFDFCAGCVDSGGLCQASTCKCTCGSLLPAASIGRLK